MGDLNFAQTMRLIWIDATIHERGTLNRSDLCRTFKISVGQAASDLRVFTAAFPDRLTYDRSFKVYRNAPRSAAVYSGWARKSVLQAAGTVHAVMEVTGQ